MTGQNYPALPPRVEITKAHWDRAVEEIEQARATESFCGPGMHCVMHQVLRPHFGDTPFEVQEGHVAVFTDENPYQILLPLSAAAVRLVRNFDQGNKAARLPLTLTPQKRGT